MPTATTFEGHTLAKVEEALALLPLDAVRGVIGSGYLGTFSMEADIGVDPEPSEDIASPTCWGRRGIRFAQSSETFGGSVQWQGFVDVLFRVEATSRVDAISADYFAAVREAFGFVSSSSDIYFDVKAPSHVQPTQDGWAGRLLSIPFQGV